MQVCMVLQSELAVKDMEIAQLADELLTAKNTIANFSGPGGLQDDLQRAQSTIEAVSARVAVHGSAALPLAAHQTNGACTALMYEG